MTNLNMYLDRRWCMISREWFENDSVMARERLGIVRYFAAAFVLIFTLGVGNAWGEIALSSSDVTLNTFPTIGGSGYQTKADYTISGYSGFSITDCLLSSSLLQMKASSGKLTSPTITSSNGFDIEVTYSSTANMTISAGGSSSTAASVLKLSVSSTSTTFTLSTGDKYATISSIVIKPKSAAYTITATRNNNLYGTVSVSGSTITATPTSGYRVKSGTEGYTIISGNATVVNNGDNTFTVTPTSDCTVQINFESKDCTDHGASSITSGASSGDDYGPLHAYYKYSTSQILYTKSDLDLAAGKKGTIKSIYFQYSGAAAMAARTIKIYMANTALSSLTTSNYVPYASFTQVYSGTFSCGSAGWYEITLDTPFEYDGAANLAVMVDDNTNSYQDDKNFKYHSASGKQIYQRQDASDINPASWTPASAIDYRPNTKFCIQEADMVQHTVNWYVNGSLEHSQTDYPGTALTGIPTPDESDCDGSKVFVGWYTSTYSHATDAPAFVSPTTIPNGDANYYAVFADAADGSSSKTYEATIQRSHVPASYGGAMSIVTAHETGGGEGELTISLSGSNVMQGTGDNNTKIQFRKTNDGAGTIYNTTDLGTINSITTNNSDIKYYINSTSNPSSAGSGGYFRVYNNVNSARYTASIVINFTKTVGGTTYSNYATTCCTQLAQINGAVNWT